MLYLRKENLGHIHSFTSSRGKIKHEPFTWLGMEYCIGFLMQKDIE